MSYFVMGIRRSIYDNFFLVLLSFALYGVLVLLAPFAGVLVGALMCSITFYPMYAKLERWMPNSSATLRAALSDLIVTIFFVAPLFLLLWATYQESASLIPTIKQGISAFTDLSQGNVTPSMSGINHLREFLSNAFGIRRAQFQSHVLISVNRLSEYASAAGAALATNTIAFVVDLGVMLGILFFMFRDGETLGDYLQGLIPMREENKIQIRIRMRDMVIDVVRGWLLTSFIQGIAAIIGYTIVRTKGAFLLGTLTAMFGLVPIVGTSAVSVPVAIYFFYKGAYLKGTFLLLWGLIVVVGVIDMLLRPYLMGRRAELPMFALFFALLGGTRVWGAKGLILGPLLIGIIPILLDIYRQRYLRKVESDEKTTDSSKKLISLFHKV